MKKAIVIVLCWILLPYVSVAGTNLSSNFTYGFAGYWGNSTDIVLELPADFNLQAGFSISSSSAARSTSFSLGGGKDLFFQMISLNALYSGNRSGNYFSDTGEFTFSIRPLLMLVTLLDLQAEIGYSYTAHTNNTRTEMLPCHSWRIGLGLGILQTTELAIAYTSYNYFPSVPGGKTLEEIQKYIYATQNMRLAGVLGVISGFPGSTIDFSISRVLFDRLNVYANYSWIQYSLDKSTSNSILIGADYFLLDNLSPGLAYNIFLARGSAPAYYISAGISFNF